MSGKLVVEPPTLICLGFEWYVTGDADQNAEVAVLFRKKGAAEWRHALPLLRTSRPPTKEKGDETVHLLAGSILDLQPDTEYECRLTMADPDGVEGEATKQLTVRTRAEPKPFEGGRVRHVYPFGYRGKKEQPAYRNLLHAYYDSRWDSDTLGIGRDPVRPGDTILVHAGLYKCEPQVYHQKHGSVVHGAYVLTMDGTADKPIAIRAAGDGSVVIDGAGCYRLFDVTAADHHLFEGLILRNTDVAFFAGLYNAYGCDGLVVKDCVMQNINIGVLTQWHGSDGFTIADNWFIGRFGLDRFQAWGPVKSYFAVKVNGSGHVICHNYVAGFYDGIDILTEHNLNAGTRCAIDVYNNDLFRMNDNFLEADGATHNVRFLRNRGINCGSIGISNQPVHGGPAYWIRNVSYNASTAGAIKNLANPHGVLVYHNTITGNLTSWGTPPYGYVDYRNNLFLGHGMDPLPGRGDGDPGKVIAWASTDRRNILDYNGHRLGKPAGPGGTFFEWLDPAKPGPRLQLTTFDEFRQTTGLEQHGVAIDFDVFQRVPPVDYGNRQVFQAAELDFRLKPGSRPVDAGVRLPGVNDDHTGKAPDLGAYEAGRPIPHYGPRTGRGLEQILAQSVQVQARAAGLDAPLATKARAIDRVTHAKGVIESITVGAYTVTAGQLVTGTTSSAAKGAMAAVGDLDLTTGVASPGDGGPWAFDTLGFRGALWRDTNGEAPDFFLFECGGNDIITMAAILANGKAGKPVAIPRNAWKATGVASKVASGNAAGVALEITSLLDPQGKPLDRSAVLKGLRIHGDPNGIDPLSLSAVAPPRQ